MNEINLITNYWHYGCSASELSKEGDYLLFKLGKYDVVLYHDGNEVIAFDNLCPHRGTKFFDEFEGNSKAFCKYHGWSYSHGSVVVPNIAGLESNGCPKLNKYFLNYCGNFVFFAIEPVQSLTSQLGEDLFELLESLSFDVSRRSDYDKYIYQCYWPISIENALEPTHVPFIHKNNLGSYGLFNMVNKFWVNNSGVYFDVSNKRIVDGFSRIDKYYNLSQYAHKGYMSIFLFPFSFISSTWGSTYSIQNFFPCDNNNTWFHSRLYEVSVESDVGAKINQSIVRSAIKTNREIFLEDHSICKRISPDFWLKNIDGPLYKEESKIRHFRQTLKNLGLF